MKRISPYSTLFLFWICFSIPIVNVITRSVSVVSLICWITSIVLFCTVTAKKYATDKATQSISKEGASILLLCIVHLISLWAVGLNSNHFHRDEFIMAYTSYVLPSFLNIDWFAGFPNDWIAQYPILFHILQKPFLVIFGPSLDSIRYSIWPYCVGIIIYLYLLLRRTFTERIASILVLVYIFWAPTLYFFSIGIHNASSTLFILGVLYHCSAFIQSRSRSHSILLSIYLACSFLTYTGSYIAIAIPVMAIASTFRKQGGSHIRTPLLYSLLLTGIILTPFIVHALTVHNYFFDRFNAVNLYNGYWTNSLELRANGVPLVSILFHSTITAFISLFIPGIAGFSGYYFGFQALFTIFSIMLLGIGTVALVSKKHSIQVPNSSYILVLLVLAFIFGPATTIQPPAVHRLSVVFPLITMVMSYGLFFLYKIGSRFSRLFGTIMLGILCVMFFYFNAIHFRNMMTNDMQDYPYTPGLTSSILTNVPRGSRISIAGYFGFHLNKELLFRTQNAYDIYQDDWEHIWNSYNGEALLIINPTEEEIVQISKAYPDHIMEFYGYEEYSERILSEPCIFIYPTPPAEKSSDIIEQ